MMPMKLTGPVAVILLALAALASSAPSKEPLGDSRSTDDSGGVRIKFSSASEDSGSVKADGALSVAQNKAAEEPVDRTVPSAKGSASGGNCAASNIDAMTLSVPVDAGTIVNLLANTGCKLMCKGGNSGKAGKGGNSNDDDAAIAYNAEGTDAADATGSARSGSASSDRSSGDVFSTGLSRESAPSNEKGISRK